MDNINAYDNNILRKNRKIKGLCVQCGAVLDRKGTYCVRCNIKNNEDKYNSTQKLHNENKCTDCGKPLDREGWVCTICLKKSNARAREKNEERRKNKECIQCGAKIDEEERIRCRRCLDMRMDRYYKKKNKGSGV